MANSDAALINEAREILRGAYKRPSALLALAKRLKEAKQFGYARRVLARARRDSAVNDDAALRLEIHQQSALCTYKDPDLPADSRLDRALEILREVEDISRTRNPETLGLVGAIYKRKWEVDNQRPQLERALFYYLRGYEESRAVGQAADQGYNGINAAFILDLLARQEAEEAAKAGAAAGEGVAERIDAKRGQAREIRHEVADKVVRLAELPETNWLRGKWWFYSTVAEAHFGLGAYDSAVSWLEDGRRALEGGVPEWQYESTMRQLATLARLQSPVGAAAEELENTPAWDALERFAGGRAAVRSAFYGKVGLGLSGGGFRASLYHIGVLAKLAELDVLRRVEVLSCVSGGSVIGAHYYLEVRKLLQEKADEEITREDYIEVVRRVQEDFLRGVQRNVRMRVAAEPLTNLRMIFGGNYSRTMRAGELFESEIFSRVRDGGGDRPRFINELYVRPKGEPESFRPKFHNWRREAKAPILILNAATLNTGHTWHFTASYMGEPPAAIDTTIDGNDRFRRMYYEEAPEGHRRVRLGHAVAASACVPGLFDPIAFENLYPGRVVRLVDGGVCDNQGVGGLLEQDCNVILVSDASGQMETVADPKRGPFGVMMRSTSIIQSRVRQAQHQDLRSRRRSQLLRGFMFVHLKEDLGVDPVDWVDCLDPYDADDDDSRPAGRRGPLTRYGIAKKTQHMLSAVRTDLDSFSDVEAYALMTSAYRMTEHAFAEGNCVEGFDPAAEPVGWDFLAVKGGLKGAGRHSQFVERLLGVSGARAFKVWKLRKGLRYLSVVLALAAFVLGVWAAIAFRDATVVKAVTVGAIGMFFVSLGLTALGTALVGKKLMKVIRLRETLTRAAIGFGVGILGWLAARLHLHVFDPMFLREGSIENYMRHAPPPGRGPKEVATRGTAGNGHAAAATHTAAAVAVTAQNAAAPSTPAHDALTTRARDAEGFGENGRAAQTNGEQFPALIEIEGEDEDGAGG